MNNLIIKTIEHKGIRVMMKIDYDKGELSFMESNYGNWQNKNWVFANRGLEYMQGWLDILDAMKFAVGEGKKELEKDKNEKGKVMVDEIGKKIMLVREYEAGMHQKHENKTTKSRRILK